MLGRIKSLLLAFSFLLTLFTPSSLLLAWGGKTHRLLSKGVLAQIEWRDELQFEEALLHGTAAPDLRGKGWLPPSYHGYDPKESGRWPGLAPRAIGDLMNKIRARASLGRQACFDSGRVLHLLQDLTQPFHTGSGRNEGAFHYDYEAWVDERAENMVAQAVAAYCKREESSWDMRPKDLACSLARNTRRDYLELHQLCREKPWGRELEEFTVRRFVRAIEVSVEALRIMKRRVPDSPLLDIVELLGVFVFSLTLHILFRSKRRLVRRAFRQEGNTAPWK